MAGRPLRPATRHSLGEPLPHQLADRARAPPISHCCFNLSAYGVLAFISKRCPPLWDSFSCCTHPSAAPSVIRIATSYVVARLACVKHAASVRPEPGSNSQLNTKLGIPQKWKELLMIQELFLCRFAYNFVKVLSKKSAHKTIFII